MYRNNQSHLFAKYLKETVDKLIEPIENIQWKIWESGDATPNAIELISNSLWAIGVFFSNIDGEFSDSEVSFIIDVRSILGGEAFDDVPTSKYREFYLNSYYELESLRELTIPPFVSFLKIYDDAYDTNYAYFGKQLALNYINILIKADGKISEIEQLTLQKFKELLFDEAKDGEISTIGNSSEETKKHEDEKSIKSTEELIIELNEFVGLKGVKNDINELINFLRVQKMRKEKGMDVQPISRHLVFFGNPGTGKTTIARVISKIYSSLGILSKGHLIETDRAGLVAGYVGQTAIKVKEVVDKAIGGVLFIDEAYTLGGGGDSDFGKEAIDTLLKIMEDNRDDLVVIVAGYTEKMKNFLNTNPGFRSRFNKYFDFEDYSESELIEITEKFCKTGGYNLTIGAIENLKKIFSHFIANKNEQFGNGRLARNIYETTISNQANRIVKLNEVNIETLSEIISDDIPNISKFSNHI